MLRAKPDLVLLIDREWKDPEIAQRFKKEGTRLAFWATVPADAPPEGTDGEMLVDAYFSTPTQGQLTHENFKGVPLYDLPPFARTDRYYPHEETETPSADLLVLGLEELSSEERKDLTAKLKELALTKRVVVVTDDQADISYRPAGISSIPGDELGKWVSEATAILHLLPAEEEDNERIRDRCRQRLVDAAACGAAQVVPLHPAFTTLLIPEGEAAVYRSSEERDEHVQRLLEEETYRRQMALSSLRRTWASHTALERMETLLLTAIPRLAVRQPLVRDRRAASRFGFPRFVPKPAAKSQGEANLSRAKGKSRLEPASSKKKGTAKQASPTTGSSKPAPPSAGKPLSLTKRVSGPTSKRMPPRSQA